MIIRPTTRAFTEPPLFRHDAVEYFAVPDHAELLAGDAFLDCGIRFEIVRELGERIELAAQRRDPGTFIGELAPDRDPVGGAVLATPDGEREQPDPTGDPGNPNPRHRPYRWRPG